jgi:type VI secretion system secreted protein VgrG
MNKSCLPKTLPQGVKGIPISVSIACALAMLHFNASANEIDLGTANNFAILAGSTVTSTGNTVINGDLGLSPGSSVTGFGPGVVNGTMHLADPVALQAQKDLATAYNTAAGFSPTEDLTGQNLGGLTLTPGVYHFSSSGQLTGTLTLNGEGLADPVFVFQIGSTLTTASDSSVVTINDAGSLTPGISVFWQVGSSATLGTDTAFEGNILALTSITATTGATDLDGRLLAENGAVTLNDNTITAPPAEPQGLPVPDKSGTLPLLATSVAGLIAFKRRFPGNA